MAKEAPNHSCKEPESKPDNGFGTLATQALSTVATRGTRSQREIRTEWLDRLEVAACQQGREACLELVNEIRDTGVSREEIADFYVPELSRRLGDRWCEDSLSFAEVTIGVSRLQSLLRDLGPEWRSDCHAGKDGATALIIVAVDNYHTLGAMLLAGRLRRRGLSVRLAVGVDADEVANIIRHARFSAVMFSVCIGESLEKARVLVEKIRETGEVGLPVIVGGLLAENSEVRGELERSIGCDLVTNDIDEALGFCKLTTSTRAGGPHNSRG